MYTQLQILARGAAKPISTGILQRKCACGQHTVAGGECEECRQKREGMMQRAAVSAAPVNDVPPVVHEVLSSPGLSLDAGTRAFMEPRFGYDFSQVCIHTDAKAAESARAVNALAYTVGSNVVFGMGQYEPGTTEGRRLLAHELTHVVQQGGASGPSFSIGSENSAYEQNADLLSEQIMSANPSQSATPIHTPFLLRKPKQHSTPHRPAPQHYRQKQSQSHRCNQPITPATNFREFVDLVRRAETALIRCGHTSIANRLHVLSGIYYGTVWSLDFQTERSEVRNLGFETYTAGLWGAGDDPRACLGCGLFLSLQRSQDVTGVDMGHVIIGIDARERPLSREREIPLHNATGLEMVTWVGDLGGATGRLALDRVGTPGASPNRYFSSTGTDYGAPSNLEGDVDAYVVAAGSGSTVTAPVISVGGTIADALEAYFVSGTGYMNRCRRFLELQGGHFTGTTLSNRSVVEATMARKLEGFGRLYMANFERQRGRIEPLRLLAANSQLSGAARSIAVRFVDWLLGCMLSNASPSP